MSFFFTNNTWFCFFPCNGVMIWWANLHLHFHLYSLYIQNVWMDLLISVSLNVNGWGCGASLRFKHLNVLWKPVWDTPVDLTMKIAVVRTPLSHCPATSALADRERIHGVISLCVWPDSDRMVSGTWGHILWGKGLVLSGHVLPYTIMVTGWWRVNLSPRHD